MFRTVIQWIFLAPRETEEFTIEPVTRYIGGKKVAVVRNNEGIYAFEDRCPHNGFELSRGKCTADGKAIICPLHRFAFDLKTGRALTLGGVMRTFPVELRENGWYIGFERTEWGWFKS